MKVRSAIQNLEKLYSDNLKEHGISSESVGWPNKKDHALRFDKLFESVDLKDIDSLNDLGSGYGAVLDYLSARNKALDAYYAYDISKEMLKALNIKFYPTTTIKKFLESALKTTADFSIASGIFNVHFSETELEWKKYILETLHNLNHYSSIGFAFNLLSTYVDFKRDHLYYGDPCFFFDYCKKNFSKQVSLYHDYPLWEWTIKVKK